MEVYWRLASPDADEREAATVELVRSLLPEQQAYETSERKRRADGGEKEKPDIERSDKKALLKRKREQREKAEEEEAATGILTEEKRDTDDMRRGFTSHRDEQNSTGMSNVSSSDAGVHNGEEDLHSCSPSVRYALKRLICGVASSRECARQGFAMALASLLEMISLLKIGPILRLICKTLEVTSSMKGQEKRDNFLGQLFALGAVVRAYKQLIDVADAADMENAKEITKQLLSLSKKKAFLREPAITLVIQFFEKISPDALQNIISNSPLLGEILSANIENANADTLRLALRLHKRLPNSIAESCPFLPNSKSLHATFEPSYLVSVLPILKDSTNCHPRLHSIWNALVDHLFLESSEQGQLPLSKKKKKQINQRDAVMKATEQHIAMFWKLVVDNSLLTSSHERKFLAMELVHLMLPRLSASCAHFILSKTLVRCLLDILASRGNILHKSAQTCLTFICEWAKTNDDHLVAVILSLQQASNGKFDVISRTKTVKDLVSSFKSKDGCFSLYNKLVQIFNGEELGFSVAQSSHHFADGGHNMPVEMNGYKDDEENFDKSLASQRHWVIDQIFSFAQLLRDPDLQCSLQKETIKFLTANALFVGPLGMECYLKELDVGFRFPKSPISENIRKLCLARLQNLFSNSSLALSAFQDKMKSIGKTSLELGASSDRMMYFVELCDMFDNTSEVCRVRPFREDEKDAIGALRSCLSQIFSAITETSSEQTQKLRAMHALLMQLFLQSLMTGGNDITWELIMCCKQSFGEVVRVDDIDDHLDHGSEKPFFMDVLVEVLLSLLAQSSASIRFASEQVFKSFCGELTQSSMLSLLRVVKKPLHVERRALTTLDANDSDDDQFLELEESDDGSSDNDNDGSVVNSDEENDEVFEKPNIKRPHMAELETKEDIRLKSKEVVAGDHERSTVSSDLEDDTSSDMDDEAMFKIDVHLANLIKQKKSGSNDKSGGKDAQIQLLHFKFRVLSLLEFFFQRKASSPLCLLALPHLLQALVASSSSAGDNQEVAEKISSVLMGKLVKSKEYPKGPEVDKATVSSLLQQCMKLASRSKVKKIGQVLQSCVLWLVKVLHGLSSEADAGEDVDIPVRDAMKDFFHQRKCRLKAAFFRELFSRFPGTAFANLNLLIESCSNARTEFLQQEALLLVNFILHANSGKGNDKLRSSISQNLPSLTDLLVCLIEKPPSHKIKQSEIRRYCVILFKAVAQELPEKSVKKRVGKSVYDLCLSRFGSSIADDIVKPKGANSNSAQESENTNRKRHRQKKSSHDS